MTRRVQAGPIEVSREEYAAWYEFWEAAWDAVEVKVEADAKATKRYVRAFAALSRIVGMPGQ